MTDTTAYRVICNAMQNAGYLAQGQDPNSDQVAKYMNRLNDFINFQQTQGLKLWLQEDFAITLTAGVGGPGNPYSLGPSGNIAMTKPLRVPDTGNYYLDVNQISRPINLLAKTDYATLSNVFQGGPITSIYVDKQQLSLNVYTWYIPDAIAAQGTLHVLLQQQVTNVISVTDTMAFPLEWFIYLHWGLADEICTGQPQAIMDRCERRAMMYKEALEAWDVEDASTIFQPDFRVSVGSAFNR
jgi:hypothetical protein